MEYMQNLVSQRQHFDGPSDISTSKVGEGPVALGVQDRRDNVHNAVEDTVRCSCFKVAPKPSMIVTVKEKRASAVGHSVLIRQYEN